MIPFAALPEMVTEVSGVAAGASRLSHPTMTEAASVKSNVFVTYFMSTKSNLVIIKIDCILSIDSVFVCAISAKIFYSLKEVVYISQSNWNHWEIAIPMALGIHIYVW